MMCEDLSKDAKLTDADKEEIVKFLTAYWFWGEVAVRAFVRWLEKQ